MPPGAAMVPACHGGGSHYALSALLASEWSAVATLKAEQPGHCPHHAVPPAFLGSHTHSVHQAVCAPLLVAVFVAEAAGDSQAGAKVQ